VCYSEFDTAQTLEDVAKSRIPKIRTCSTKNDKRSKKTVTGNCWGSKMKLMPKQRRKSMVEDVLNAGNRSLL
jgi:hypothetical protein